MDYDSYLEHPTPPPPPRVVKKVPSQTHQSHPQTTPTKPIIERFHPYPRPPRQPAAQATSAVSSVPQNSQSRPTKPPSSNQRAAEMFLDEMETSLRPPIRVKPEPVEPTIPSVRRWFNHILLGENTFRSLPRVLPLRPWPRDVHRERKGRPPLGKCNSKEYVHSSLVKRLGSCIGDYL